MKERATKFIVGNLLKLLRQSANMKLNEKQKLAVAEEVERRLANFPTSVACLLASRNQLQRENELLRRKLLHRALMGNSICTQEETIAIVNESLSYLATMGRNQARIVSIIWQSLSFRNNLRVRTCRVHFDWKFEKFEKPGRETFWIELEGDGLNWRYTGQHS